MAGHSSARRQDANEPPNAARSRRADESPTTARSQRAGEPRTTARSQQAGESRTTARSQRADESPTTARSQRAGEPTDPQPWPRAVLHLDMDAFFVAVHRLDHPEDIGIPLVVGGHPDGRGVVAAASYEARQFGIHSAMPTRAAVRLCPSLKIVGHDWQRIRDCSRHVMSVLGQYGPLERLGADEAYVDLTGSEDPESLASRIRQHVTTATSLPCSVGLATSKLVAKVASDHDKPEGCTIVAPGSEARFLAPLPVRVIPGIGPRTAERLDQLGISTCGDLAGCDAERLANVLGEHARSLQRRATGEDHRPVVTERGPVKSISNERTFSRDMRAAAELDGMVRHLASSVAASLRRRGLVAHTVFVKLRWHDFTTITRQVTVDIAVCDDRQIEEMAVALWRANWTPGLRVRLVGVGVRKLAPADRRQLPLGV